MSSKTRTSLLSLMIIAVIVFSAFGTTTVYADGDPPPEPPATEIVDSADEAGPEATAPATGESTEATGTPEPTVEVDSDSVEATAEPTSAPDEIPTEAGSDGSDPNSEAAEPQATEESAPVAEESTPAADSSLLNGVPENTTVTVLDANGEAQPLATEAAAEAMAASDPIWCPQGTDPVPGAGGCTGSFTSFSALLQELADNPTLYTGAGTIYVEQGAYQGGESTIDFNAYDLSSIRNADLIVSGGWNTSTGLVDPTTPSTFNNTAIVIGASGNPWGGSLTLSNISLAFSNNSNSGTGITLHAQNDILLSNVDVTNSWNGAGAELNAGGDVSIADSDFSRNKTAGAVIKSGGSVDIAASSFSNPANARRQITGLDITATSVSLFQVLTEWNREVGTNIVATEPVTITDSVFSHTKAMAGSGATTTFLGYGLQIETPGTIDLRGVTGSDNFLWGAFLRAGGNIAIFDSIFDDNTTASPGFIDDTGLFIRGGAAVDMFNVEANRNRLFGAQIEAVGPVSISDSVFSDNMGVITIGGVTTDHGHGLQITTQSDISLNNVIAINNMLFGAQLNSGGTEVAISSSTFSNTSTGSSSNAVGKGLEIISAGTVSLFDVLLDNNQTVGANIQSGGAVSLTNVTATNNGTDGVVVQGACVAVTGGTFTGNGGIGLNLGSTPACVLPLSGGNTVSAASPNVFASLQIAPQQIANTGGTGNLVSSASVAAGTATNTGNVTLNSFMANIRTTTGGVQLSIFMGKYAYIYSSAGLHIIAFSPALNGIAMDGPYKAY